MEGMLRFIWGNGILCGLKVRKLGSFNQAQLGKWWDYEEEENNLWRRVIGTKMGMHGANGLMRML